MSDSKDHAPPSAPLRSLHTESFPAILQQLGVSVLVTTYQAGKLAILRASGGVLNAHFRGFHQPMGLAIEGDRLAIGTALEIWEYRNIRAAAEKLDPAGQVDACFFPRRSHTTGNIQVHELAWGRPASDAVGSKPELWCVNTRFSCLCTFDHVHSFVPRWKPSFISRLAPEDRCHLNGLAMADGRPAFVTALGETDAPNGWRVNKRDGGIVLDVATGNVIARGLSMPHSPRWHDGKLWVLESGTGGLGFIDPTSQNYERIAELPGFTRGLDFVGRYAFIGLSQVRESAIFSGIHVSERRLEERQCGVWVVDVVTGNVVAFVSFEDALQEIFAVQVAPGLKWPDVVNDDLPLLADTFVLPDAL